MKAFYDKLILLVGIIILAGGVYLFLNSRDAEDKVSGLSVPANPYEALSIDDFSLDAEAREWAKPEAQPRDTNAVFDLFTPPKIYYNPTDRVFTFDAGEDPPPPPRPFGVELAKMERELYRLQLEGFLQGPAGDEDNYFILMRNTRTGEGLRAREGDVFAEQRFVVKSFSVERRLVTPEDENVTPYVVEDVELIIEDQEINQDIMLTVNDLRYNPGFDIVLRATDNSGRTWEVENEGESFDHDGAKFTVTKINLENRSVTVEKTGPDMEEPVVRELSLGTQTTTPSGNSRPAAPAPAPSRPSGGGANSLENLFPL